MSMKWERYDREWMPALIVYGGRLTWVHGSRKRAFTEGKARGKNKPNPVLENIWMRPFWQGYRGEAA